MHGRPHVGVVRSSALGFPFHPIQGGERRALRQVLHQHVVVGDPVGIEGVGGCQLVLLKLVTSTTLLMRLQADGQQALLQPARRRPPARP